MKIGFTGTQQGMSGDQITTFIKLLRGFVDQHGAQPFTSTIMEFHHGDCIGADKDAHDIVRTFSAINEMNGIKIISHPPTKQKKRSFTIPDEERSPKAYLDRNHDIVDECGVLFACPKGFTEEKRSGTWATIRYAIKTKKPVYVILPSGEVSQR